MSSLHKKIVAVIGILFALAVAIGVLQRDDQKDPELQSQEVRTELFETEPAKLNKGNSGTYATTFLAGGDVSLSRNIAYQIDREKDAQLPFRSLESLFKSVDFTFANLETPFSKSDAYTPKNTLVFNAPKKNVEGLVKNKFKVVSLANNHAMDQGLDGLLTTRSWLTENGILHTGTGKNLGEAWTPVIYESNGIKIGFISASYSSVNDGGKATNPHVARIEDTVNLKKAIGQARLKGANYVIAAMHAGTEYVTEPIPSQVKFAHAAIDLGADMVIGHHSHWVQTIEEYCPTNSPPLQGGVGGSHPCKYIFYGLGNFIFDQSWSQETMEGLLLKISLKKQKDSPAELSEVKLLPIIIENNSTPRLADEVEGKKILDGIGQEETKIIKH